MKGRITATDDALSRSAQAAAGDRALSRTSAAPADFDTQLMLRARAGDREAAGALIDRMRDRIARYVARLLHDARAAEDITQDVFVQALAHSDQFEPTAPVAPWLYRIATNLSLNYLKRAAVRRRTPSPQLALAQAHDSAPPPDRQLSLDELRAQVAVAVQALSANQRVALTLYEYENCSYEQIATVLNTTLEAVRSLLLRARRNLRRKLEGTEGLGD
jgi:RNA polymerase sigma-70 factor, ECF subfamily